MDVDNMQAVIDAARRGFDLVTLAGDAHNKIIYTPSHGVQTVSLEKLNQVPARKIGSVVVFDAASLNQMLADNAVPGATTVYINPDTDKPTICAVVNGNGAAGPGFGDFKIHIGFRETPQWKKWKSIDGRLLPQTEFAEFVEENLQDIVTPDGATMMEIVSDLQAKRTVDFRSAVRLKDGNIQFQNNEDLQASVGTGQTAIPDTFEIVLSPVFGVVPFRIPARFRYRLEDRKLKLGFKLLRLESVIPQMIAGIEVGIVFPDGVAKVYGIAP